MPNIIECIGCGKCYEGEGEIAGLCSECESRRLEAARNADHDIPDGLIAVIQGMVDSRIMEKLALTEEIVEATDLTVEEAFEKANAAIRLRAAAPSSTRKEDGH